MRILASLLLIVLLVALLAGTAMDTVVLLTAAGGDTVRLPAGSIPCLLLAAEPGVNWVSGPGAIHVDCR